MYRIEIERSEPYLNPFVFTGRLLAEYDTKTKKDQLGWRVHRLYETNRGSWVWHEALYNGGLIGVPPVRNFVCELSSIDKFCDLFVEWYYSRWFARDVVKESHYYGMVEFVQQCGGDFIKTRIKGDLKMLSIWLNGPQGNAFYILGAVTRIMKQLNVSEEDRDKYMSEAKSGDYNNLLNVTRKTLDDLCVEHDLYYDEEIGEMDEDVHLLSH